MKTNYIDLPPKRCQTCKHGLSKWGAWLCMDGAEKLPPSGNYVGPNDPIGHASIYKKDEADFYEKFTKDRAVEKLGFCDDYTPNVNNEPCREGL